MDIHDYQQNGNGLLHFWHRARLGLIKYSIRDLKNNITIASIGCGTGEELTILTKQAQVVGYDINQTALNLARQQGFKTAYFDIAKNQLPTKYDVITAFDVLEHIKDDEFALKNISRSLKADGYFLLTVPAYQWLMSSHDLALGHYRRYGQKDLKQKLAKANLKLIKIGRWNSFLAIFIIIVRLFKKIWPPNESLSELKKTNYFIDKLLYLILSWEVFLIRLGFKLPIGISLYAIAQKK